MIKLIKYFLLLIAIITILIVFPKLSYPMLEENWPTFMGNNFLTGNIDGIPPRNFNLLWSFNRGGVLYNPRFSPHRYGHE